MAKSQAKSRKLEAILAQLAEIRHQPVSAETTDELRQILRSKFSVAIAQAAKLVHERELRSLIPDLLEAFDRCLIHPVEADPNCHAKAGIADALYHLESSEEGVFLKGIRHVQREPVWGGKVDTAAKLRGICAMGLVRMNYPEVLIELGDLLADPEPEARIAAARAIAYHGSPGGIPLLRLRARVGDEPVVLSECLATLLTLDADRSLPFVSSFLDAPLPQTQELVALVLGESRLPTAFPLLQQWWEQVREPELRRTGLLAIATLRQDPPLSFLLDLLATGTRQNARDAIIALDIYRSDPTLWQRVAVAVEQREDNASLNSLLNKT